VCDRERPRRRSTRTTSHTSFRPGMAVLVARRSPSACVSRTKASCATVVRVFGARSIPIAHSSRSTSPTWPADERSPTHGSIRAGGGLWQPPRLSHAADQGTCVGVRPETSADRRGRAALPRCAAGDDREGGFVPGSPRRWGCRSPARRSRSARGDLRADSERSARDDAGGLLPSLQGALRRASPPARPMGRPISRTSPSPLRGPLARSALLQFFNKTRGTWRRTRARPWWCWTRSPCTPTACWCASRARKTEGPLFEEMSRSSRRWLAESA